MICILFQNYQEILDFFSIQNCFSITDSPNVAAAKPETNANHRTEEKIVSYEVWRDAMIKRAESELKKMQQNAK